MAAKQINKKLIELEKYKENEQLKVRRSILINMEKWLDKGCGHCYCANVEIAAMIREAIRHREEEKIWEVIDYVIMPNHIHLFIKITYGSLEEAISSFKKWTGHRALEIVRSDKEFPENNGMKRFWQDGWFDHWSRSFMQDERIISYIRNNPVKAGLVNEYMEWPYGGWHD